MATVAFETWLEPAERILLATSLLVVGVGCQTGTTETSHGAAQTSSAVSAAGSSGASSGGSSASTGGSTSAGMGGGSGSTSAGTGTGGRTVPFIDGGYVFCTAEVTVDGGQSQARWMCPPGTYFCLSPGNCAQCLSDSDCSNEDLPTYGPTRQHCDLDSGVAGYQGFCQPCVRNADCAAAGVDNQCDLDPESAEPSIDMLGFETCANLGPGCLYGTRPAIGGCANYGCKTDADCADAISSGQSFSPSQVAQPFCAYDGSCSNNPDPAFCPNCSCFDEMCPIHIFPATFARASAPAPARRRWRRSVADLRIRGHWRRRR